MKERSIILFNEFENNCNLKEENKLYMSNYMEE